MAPAVSCVGSGRATRCHTPELPMRESSSRLSDNTIRDNIKVAVRIRPLSDKESARGDRAVWGVDGSGGVGLLPASGDRPDVKFAYDVVLDASSSNEQVFDQVAWPAIAPVLQGISGTVFAYGVTSSGKTHTMMGTPSDAGVVPRAITALFEAINKSEDSVYCVKLSMMEIYCEMLNDLLDGRNLNLDVQECQSGVGKGSVLVIKGLTEGKVASAAEALALIQQGQENRKVASTAYNDQSSRSHTICRLLVEASPRRSTNSSSLQSGVPAVITGSSDSSSSRRASVTGLPGGSGGSFSAAANCSCTSAWLTLVDLAGSEGARAALSKDQQAEARDINRSLLTLGKVMYELAKGNSAGHLPFRDSLLTRLLKPCLTGTGAKVAIICNVTPAASQSDETWNTLRFADGAKRIKITAVKNEALDVAAVVARYQREVAALKAQLAALSGAAAASGAGELSVDVLHAIKDTLDSSSQDNAAEQLQDQAAQLAYLQECLSFAMQERNQLLTMNKCMTAMLVQQVHGAAAGLPPPPAAADAVVAEPANMGEASAAAATEEALAPEEAAAAAVHELFPVSSRAFGCRTSNNNRHAAKRAARIRRCLSYESLEFYGQWQGSSSRTQRAPQGHATLDEPGLECNAADAAEVQQLLRITGEELPDSLTHGLKQELPHTQADMPPLPPAAHLHLHQQQQQHGAKQAAELGPPAAAGGETALAEKAPAASVAAAAPAPGNDDWQIPAVVPPGAAKSQPGIGRVSDASTCHSAAAAGALPPVLSMYYSAISSFGGLSSCSDESKGSSNASGSANGVACAPAPAHAAAGAAAAAAAAAAAPFLPCPIVFPGSRRTSKTLAVGLPGSAVSGRAASAAGWLGCVGLPVLPEGVVHSALSEVVDAHLQLAEQKGRLRLLEQQLADKETLLQQARLLQQGQHLQLRLTITAADRALLRDKLAEAEQQVASYKAQAAQYEGELHELFDQASQFLSEAQELAKERDALAAQLVQLQVATPSSGGDMAPTGALAATSGTVSRTLSRCSSGCSSLLSSPEPSSRIPLAPGGPTRHATYGGSGSSSPTLPSLGGRVTGSGGSFSKSLGSPARKSAAAAATFNSIKAAMTGAVGTASTGSQQSTKAPLSPRLAKLLAAGPPALALGSSSVAGPLAGTSSVLGPSYSPRSSPFASPGSLSRSNSSLVKTGPPVLAHPATAGAAPGKERDSKLRKSWGSGTDAQAGAGGFNPICITSPFHEQLPALAAFNAANARSSTDTASVSTSYPASDGGVLPSACNSLRRSGSGSSARSIPRQQHGRTMNESVKTVGGCASSSIGGVLQGQQSRIPLPPFLKRPSKRMMQLCQSDHGDTQGGSPSNSPRYMDRCLLGMHGNSTMQPQDPLLVTQGLDASQLQAAPVAGSTLAPGCHKSPFAAAAVAESASDAEAPPTSELLSPGGTTVLGGTQSVRSHPLELPEHVLAGWSARSPEVAQG